MRAEHDMVQVAPKSNGHSKPIKIKLSDLSGHQRRGIATFYKGNGRQPTLQKYPGLGDSVLYPILHAAGVRLSGGSHKPKSKGRRADSKPKRGVGKGSRRAAPAAPYKPRRDRSGGAVGDALVYLDKARGRLLRSLGGDPDATGAALGLVSLAIESLRGEIS